jgi:hypothetical protein
MPKIFPMEEDGHSHLMSTSTGDQGIPPVVAICAMGASINEYLSHCLAQSSRWRVADETWAINACAGVIQHDRAFIMDRLSYFREAAKTNSPLDGYRDWLHLHQGPIYTSELDPNFPGGVLYPLQEVVNNLGFTYFNSTVAYAVAYAIHIKVKEIKLYGCDFMQNDTNDGRKGRACVEYWIAIAISRGIKVVIANSSSLCDQNIKRPLYGYSTPTFGVE